MNYNDFLSSKALFAESYGFELSASKLEHLDLFDWQTAITLWALKKGRAAIFADTGLGKTRMQLAWAWAVSNYFPGGSAIQERVLIFAPLAVAHQTVKEGERMGIRVKYVRSQAEVEPGISIANYEMLEHFDPLQFVGIVLDESSILKSYMGSTKRLLVEAFRDTPYRLACTATPNPNDTAELGNHAEFLGIMEPPEMLTRWFINDTSKAQTFRLKRHGEADFWCWVATWAVCISKPSDLPNLDGEPYSDEGYILPPLSLITNIVESDFSDGAGEGQLFRAPLMNATGMHDEMRRTACARAEALADKVALEPCEPWALWVHTDYEADALMEALKRRGLKAAEVRGSDPVECKERLLTDFAEGRLLRLVTKPRIAGFGMNFQHCARIGYVGVSYSYEQFYQALRRFWRFGQQREVQAHIVLAETERSVLGSLERKQAEHETMKAKMVRAMRDFSPLARLTLESGPGYVRREQGRDWTMYQGDCVEVLPALESNLVGLSVFSPPFSNLYSYSPSLRDMGNTADDKEFFEHFAYLIPELLRVTIPGRLCAVHVKNLPIYKSHEGYTGIRDFRGEVIRAFTEMSPLEEARWSYHSEVCIWTDPVREMQRTKAQGLLYSQLRRDSSHSRQGMAEYLLVFRKWTPDCAAPEPVTHTSEDFPLDLWQNYASPVWFDVQRTDVLNTQIARDDKDEKHLAPLQLEVVRRAVRLWSNPGDLVLSPFGGIGSEGYGALQMGRRFVGVELKESYFKHAVKHLKAVEEAQSGALFEMVSP